jgi:hypothetical protein
MERAFSVENFAKLVFALEQVVPADGLQYAGKHFVFSP